MRNVSDKFEQNLETHILRSIKFHRKSNPIFYNVEDDNLIVRMRFVRWITRAANTQPEYVIFIVFPQDHWLLESASLLHYTYTATLLVLSLDIWWNIRKANTSGHKLIFGNVTHQQFLLLQ